MHRAHGRRGFGAWAGALALAGVALAASGAAAEEFRSSLPAEPGGSLRVRLDRGSLEVESHGLAEVRVDAQAPRGMEFDLESRNGEVELTGRGGGFRLPSLFGPGRVRVRVRVPERFSVDLVTSGGSVEVERLEGSVRARTSGGSIDVEGAHGPVELRTSGGSIRAEDVVGDLEVRTSGGNVDARGVEGRVEARTSGGSVTLLDVRGPVSAETSGGSVSARFKEATQGRLHTSGGNVEVVLPAAAGVDLEARTSGGRISLEPPLRLEGTLSRERAEGRLNGGGPKLDLRTSGGNIRVRAD